MASALLSLPQELRLLMWEFLFRSTVITISNKHVEPASSHPLALILTCTSLYIEAHHLALRFVTLSANDPVALLDRLSMLPLPSLAQIKHVRIIPNFIKLNPRNYHFGALLLGDALELLPGLQLETLVVDCFPLLRDNRENVDVLSCTTTYNLIRRNNVRHTSGTDLGPQKWKELRVIFPFRAFVGLVGSYTLRLKDGSYSPSVVKHLRKVLAPMHAFLEDEFPEGREASYIRFDRNCTRLTKTVFCRKEAFWFRESIDCHPPGPDKCLIDVRSINEIGLGLGEEDMKYAHLANIDLDIVPIVLSARNSRPLASSAESIAAAATPLHEDQSADPLPSWPDQLKPWLGLTWAEAKQKVAEMNNVHDAENDYALQQQLEEDVTEG